MNVATSDVDDNDALISARELLGCVMYGLEQDNGEIPVPTPLTNVQAKENERTALIDVYMPSQAQVNRSVNRIVTLPACLNAPLHQKKE